MLLKNKKLPIKVWNILQKSGHLHTLHSNANTISALLARSHEQCHLMYSKRKIKSSSLNRSDFDDLLQSVKQFTNNAHTESHLRILGNGNHGSPKSVLLDINKNKYLFNCGEGIARILIELNMIEELKHLHHIFLTNNSWTEVFSGVMDLIQLMPTKAQSTIFHAPFKPVHFLEEMFKVGNNIN